MTAKTPATAETAGSRIPNFFRMDIATRIDALRERTALSEDEFGALQDGTHTLKLHAADKMIENVVGVIGLPLGVGLNFLIDGRDVIVPLSVEEPSIVAGLSGAARTARASGGYVTEVDDPILIGQVQAVDVPDVSRARRGLRRRKAQIIELANSLHPNMVARGGGVRDIEVHVHRAPIGGDDKAPRRQMVVLHLLVDTRDAMGANVVNGMCEAVAGLVEEITGGTVFLRILSNLTDRALVRARVRVPTAALAFREFSGEAVRDGIVLASDLAQVDPYRATTHNKGIMNGVDAVALATGNDFRAIEAGAHAFASRSGKYRGLARWSVNDAGDLVGEIEMPMKVGTVGGSLESNPTVRLSHRVLGNPNAAELASVMGAVGLAQNYAALRALSTAGIQRNHMTLHARSVASTAGVPEEMFEEVVQALIEDGDIKQAKAHEIVARKSAPASQSSASESGAGHATEAPSAASGTVILLGEPSLVDGAVLAAPIPLAVEAQAIDGTDGAQLLMSRWGVEQQRVPRANEQPKGPVGMVARALERLGLADRDVMIEVSPHIPRALGLGSVSALGVSVIVALARHFGLKLTAEEVGALAADCARAVYGSASDVGNALATHDRTMLYRGAGKGGAEFDAVSLPRPLPLVIGLAGLRREKKQAHALARAKQQRQRNPSPYNAIFRELESLAKAGADSVRKGDFVALGDLMNICHGYLNALQASTKELEELVDVSRQYGAAGARLLMDDAGGGGVVAVCPKGTDRTVAAIEAAGYQAFAFEVPGGR